MNCTQQSLKTIKLLICTGLFVSTFIFSACAKVQNIQWEYIPEDYLRLGQIVRLGTKTEIEEAQKLYNLLLDSGVNKTEIRDGTVGLARIFCCGGPNEAKTALEIYIPSGINPEIGDIVEIKAGRPPKSDDIGKLNTVTIIRQKSDDKKGTCRWDPPDERLWVRVLRCDWMESEGWSYERHSMMSTWVKPVNK